MALPITFFLQSTTNQTIQLLTVKSVRFLFLSTEMNTTNAPNTTNVRLDLDWQLVQLQVSKMGNSSDDCLG